MCHSTMGLTRCYKTAAFLNIYIWCFQSQSIAEIPLLPLLENKHTPYGNSTSGLDFELVVVIGM